MPSPSASITPAFAGIDRLPVSLPALSHHLALGIPPSSLERGGLRHDPLDAVRAVVPAYRIASGLEIEREAEQAAHVVRHILDRMVRLRSAYAEWTHFDAPAYFDLTREQCAVLLEVSERVSAVHVLFRADLLLPAVQTLVGYWLEAGHAPLAGASIEAYERYAQQVAPELARRWASATAVVAMTRRLLSSDVDYIAANAAEEERWRWRVDAAAARNQPATEVALITPIPTLALTIDFPLPAWKQPGRKRRLMRNRERDRGRGRHKPSPR